MTKTNKKLEEVGGYSLFNDIKDNKLKTYNRCVAIFNLKELGNDNLVGMYFDNLPSEEEKLAVYVMFEYLVKDPVAVKRAIIKECSFEEDSENTDN